MENSRGNVEIDIAEMAVPVALLEGVIINPGEHGACSAVFVLRESDGTRHEMTLQVLMEMLQFAQAQHVLPELPLLEWWVLNYDFSHGCFVQGHTRIDEGV